MEPGMTMMLYIDLVLFSLLNVLLMIASIDEARREKKKRERGVKKAEGEVKRIQYGNELAA